MKKFLSLLACVALLAGIVCVSTKEAKAVNYHDEFYYVGESTVDNAVPNYEDGLWTVLNDNVLHLNSNHKPGSEWIAGETYLSNSGQGYKILYNGTDISDSYITGSLSPFGRVVMPYETFINGLDLIDMQDADWDSDADIYSFMVHQVNGISKWRIKGIAKMSFSSGMSGGNMVMIILVPNGPAEEGQAVEAVIKDRSLVTEGNTTKWVDGNGNVLWTIVETEDAITANLSDWAAINADTVNSWNASGKALDITYKYNGYTVSISLPAGEALANTGAEWYGPEYLAAVNQKYVVVKDATGLVVPNDRIYKK